MKTQKLTSLLLYVWESPTFTTWGNWAVSVLRLVVLLPFILNQLNGAENAVWLLFMNLLAFGSFADIGFTPTFTRMVAYIRGGVSNFDDFHKPITVPKQNPQISWDLMEKLYGTIGTVNLLLCFFAFTFLALFGTFSLLKPISALQNQATYWQAWAVLCISIGFIFNAKKYEAILNGLGYLPLVNRWNIVFGLLSILASLFVLLFGGNILYLMLSSQFFAILTLLRNRYLLLYQVHDKKFAAFKSFSFEPKLFQLAFGAAWRIGLVSFCSVGISEFTGLMYAQKISDYLLLGAYQLALRFMMQIAEFSKAPFYSKIPDFTRLRAAGEIDLLTFRVEKSMQLSLLFFVLGILGVGFFADWGLAFISAKAKFVSVPLWLCMGFVFFMERMVAMHAQQTATTNVIRFHYSTIFTGAVHLLLMLALIDRLGVWVFPISQGFAILLLHFWWLPKISIESMTRPAPQFLYKSLGLPLLVFAVGAVVLLVIHFGVW
jgi:hypothetical protein